MKKTVVLYVAVLSTLSGCVIVSPATTGSAPGNMASSNSYTETCRATDKLEIAALFDRWNNALLTGDPARVAANYAEPSILLPTVSNKPRVTTEERIDYFEHFLHNKPAGKIDYRWISLGCNTAVDAGLYTFTFAANGQSVRARYTYTYKWNGEKWLITSHHSSAMPEK